MRPEERSGNQTQINFLLYWFLIYFAYLSDHLIIGDCARARASHTHEHRARQRAKSCPDKWDSGRTKKNNQISQFNHRLKASEREREEKTPEMTVILHRFDCMLFATFIDAIEHSPTVVYCCHNSVVRAHKLNSKWNQKFIALNVVAAHMSHVLC